MTAARAAKSKPPPADTSAELDVALVDPRALVAHPRNVRSDVGDLAGLTASIAAQGVIEPLTVVERPDRRMQIVAGHRRAAAAIAAGVPRVPCVIRRDLSVDVDADGVQLEHVGTMLAENLHRSQLTAVEEARGVQTMLDLGADITAVVARTGLDRGRVAKAAGVARLAAPAAAAVEHAGLTLDQAAEVVEYSDDERAVEQLVSAAGEGSGRFAHALTRARQDRELADAIATKRAELEKGGRRVLVEHAADHQRAERIHNLLHDGQVLDEHDHAHDCPGSAVTIRTLQYFERGEMKVSVATDEVCTAPADNGHTQRWGKDPRGGAGSSMSDEEVERQKAERRKVLENNRAMAAANTTRRAWIREFLARPKAPKSVLRFAVEAIADRPHAFHQWVTGMSSQDAVEAWAELGLAKPAGRWRRDPEQSLTSGEHVVDARLPLQLLAHIAAGIEGDIVKDSWRRDGTLRNELVDWLDFLVGEGYELSDVEQRIVDDGAVDR